MLAGRAHAADVVHLDGATWQALQPPPAPEPPRPPPPRAAARHVTVTPAGDTFAVHARWRIEVPAPGWFEARVVGPGFAIERATIDGRPARLVAGPDGHTVSVWLDRSVWLEIDGVAGATRDVATVWLMPAVTGSVSGAAPGRRLFVAGDGAVRDGARWWTGEGQLELAFRESTPDRRDRGTLAIARSAVGLTVGDAEVLGRARLEWQLRQGELDAVAFTVAGAGGDLDVSGPGVASWTRSGDRVVARLRAVERGLVRVDVSWSSALPAGDVAVVPIPTVSPEGAFRTESVVQIARETGIDVVPTVSGTPVAPTELPAWADGVVSGTPTTAYTGAQPPRGRLDVLRFLPAEQPAAMVDVAAYTIATTDEGRAMVRAHYAVRNERAAALRVTLPPGARLVSVRVADEAVSPARDGDAWRVPLRRSVETVEGLLSFSVHLVWIDADAAWRRREARSVALAAVDAPVAVQHVTLALPVGYTSELEPGEARVVAAFSEGDGITYGFAAGDGDAAVADQLFQDAVRAWLGNDFEAAQAQLDRLRAMGADNENVRRLASNLALVDEKAGGAKDDAASRRIKEHAKARASGLETEQLERLEEAEAYELGGDYDKAEQAYRSAVEIGAKLEAVQQREDIVVESRNSAASGKLADVAKKKQARASLDRAAEAPAEAPAVAAPAATTPTAGTVTVVPGSVSTGDGEGRTVRYMERTEIDFESVDVQGELVVPQPSVVQGRAAAEPVRAPADGNAAAVVPDDAPLVVHASTVDVVVPMLGDVVRYQQMLLEPGEVPQVLVRARRRP